MSGQEENESEMELVSEEEREQRDEAERLEDHLSRFIEAEYHDALLSDANFVPAELQQRTVDLSARLQQEVLKQTELTQTVNDLQFELQRLDAQIAATRQTQTSLIEARKGEQVSAKMEAMKAAEGVRQEQVELAVRVEKLKAEVDRKRRCEEAVMVRLRDEIDKEEQEIAQWKRRIAELEGKIEAERVLGNLPGLPSERMRETGLRLVEDRRAGVQASIAKMREYVRKYDHLLSP